MSALRRLLWKLRFLHHHAKSLNRRVEVENVLAEVAAGKRPLLTPEECRELARKLSTL